jgi:uridine kinase
MFLSKSGRDKDETRVASIAVTRDGALLWLRRTDNGKLTLPGGHLEPGEEPILGAVRELREETGFSPSGDIEFLGDDVVPSNGIRVFSFVVEIPDGAPTAINDPDEEASEFHWLDELPPNGQCHVPHSSNVTLKLLGLIDEPVDLTKAEAPKEWRAKDGLRIPHRTSPARAGWEKSYHKKLVEVFGNGDARRLKKIKVPVSEHMSGHTVMGAVGPGGRDRRGFYSRMVAGGDRLPPIVVRRNGLGWHVVDGNARLTAALKHKLTHMDAYELVDSIAKSEPDYYACPRCGAEPGTNIDCPDCLGDSSNNSDADYEDEDPWVEAKYRRGGEKEFTDFLEQAEQDYLHKSKTDTLKFQSLSGPIATPLLYRAYKNSPHHPVSVLLKYIVNRIENKPFYDSASPEDVKKYEDGWLRHHQTSGKVGSGVALGVADLRQAFDSHPALVKGVLGHQKKLHDYIKKHNPQALQMVNGEPSVALTRGYKIPNPGADHDIASYSDVPDTAMSFGQHVKKWYVPLKNLWYSYHLGPKEAAGNMGPENEFLASNHPRVSVPEGAPIERVVPEDHYGYTPPNVQWANLHTSNPAALGQAFLSPTSESYRKGVVRKNKNIPTDVLHNIFTTAHQRGEMELAQEALVHPNASPQMLEEGYAAGGPLAVAAVSSHKAPPSILRAGMTHVDQNVRGVTAQNPYTPGDVLATGAGDTSSVARRVIAGHKNLSRESAVKLLHDPDSSVAGRALRRADATEEDIDFGLQHPDDNIKEVAARHANATHSNMLAASRSPSFQARYALSQREDLHPDALHALLDDPEDAISQEARRHPNLPSEDVSDLYGSGDAELQRRAVRHKNAPASIVAHGMTHPDRSVRHAAAGAVTATPQHLMEGLSELHRRKWLAPATEDAFGPKPPMGDFDISKALLHHKNATPEVLTHALDLIQQEHNAGGISDEAPFRVLVQSPHATSEHLLRSLNFSKFANGTGRFTPHHAAIGDDTFKNPNAGPDVVARGLADPDVRVRMAAVSAPGASEENLTAALNDGDSYVRRAVFDHPKVTQAHVAQGLTDSDDRVKLKAQDRARKPFGSADAHSQHMQAKMGWRKTDQGLHKSELEKMALADIRAGKKNPRRPVWDYSHLLSPEQREQGYLLKVFQNPTTNGTFSALVHPTGDPNALAGALGGLPVVGLATGHIDDWVDPKTMIIGNASVNKEHQGGKGVPMYEALLSHAKNKMGLERVRGDIHSTMAHKVHQKLAEKHGLEYTAKPVENSNATGPYDFKFGHYDYALKSELNKAVDPSDFKQILKASTEEGRHLVDHVPDLSAHPPSLHAAVEHHRNVVLDGPEKFTRQKGPGTGITKKTVYESEEGGRVMVKPYHEHLTQHIVKKGYQKFPIQGWSEMTNQALYHAAGMGHLHQKVHVSEHTMTDESGRTIKEPALVVHMEPGFKSVDEGGAALWHGARMAGSGQVDPLDARKIGLMDFLTNNIDRHGGNIMANAEGRILAIDHGRSFQYIASQKEQFSPAKQKEQVQRHDMQFDSPEDHLDDVRPFDPYTLRPDGSLPKKYDRDMERLERYKPLFEEWWPAHRDGVVKTMDERLKQIRDPEVVAHIKRNFMARVNWMDERSRDGVENYGTDWHEGTVPWYLPGQVNEEEAAARDAAKEVGQ